MRYIGFLFLLFALIIPSASADTVMVSLFNGEGVTYFSQQRIRLASAVVEGAMEVFFESDHIVFDLGLTSDEEELPLDPRTASEIARTGGAGYFLDLRIGSPDEETGIPAFLAYSFVDLAADNILTDGTIKKAEIYAEQADSIDICALLGAKAAREAIRLLK